MLVTFKTDAYASITMFGDVALLLLELMGHSGAIPGALMPEDIPVALARLKSGVAARSEKPRGTTGPGENSDDDKPHVSLARRAMPLIELLEAALANNKHVMWDS